MRAYLTRLGELQGQMVLGLTYLVVVLPVWSVLRLAGRHLLETKPRWHRAAAPRSIEDLRLPF